MEFGYGEIKIQEREIAFNLENEYWFFFFFLNNDEWTTSST